MRSGSWQSIRSLCFGGRDRKYTYTHRWSRKTGYLGALSIDGSALPRIQEVKEQVVLTGLLFQE